MPPRASPPRRRLHQVSLNFSTDIEASPALTTACCTHGTLQQAGRRAACKLQHRNNLNKPLAPQNAHRRICAQAQHCQGECT
jgi:hypothetical protein